MAANHRTYKIKEVMTGNPPKPDPILTEKNGTIINQPIIFNKDKDKMKKVDHYRVRFDIKDFNKSSIRFVPNKRDAMWVQLGTNCPQSPCELPGIFWVDEVDGDGEWIDVINMDMTEQRFQFTLNFVDKSVSNPTPADYVMLDPGGVNENGGYSGSDLRLSAFGSIAIGAAAGIVTFLGTRMLLTGW